MMDITPQTKLTDILKEYPGLLDQLIRIEPKFGLLKTPFGKMAIRNATMQDASDRYHVSMERLMNLLKDQLEKLEKAGGGKTV